MARFLLHFCESNGLSSNCSVLLSIRDCILHAQTGFGKTFMYLLLIFSVVNTKKIIIRIIIKKNLQALIVVSTRELGTQVTKVACMLAAKPI